MTGIWIRVPITTMVLVLLCGCASVGFRRGGSADAFSVASRKCESQQSLAYAQCMKAAGWQASSSADSSPLNITQKPSAEAPSKADTSGTVMVGSWWKLGGSQADLATSFQACGTKRATVYGLTTVACMKKSGWFPAGR